MWHYQRSIDTYSDERGRCCFVVETFLRMQGMSRPLQAIVRLGQTGKGLRDTTYLRRSVSSQRVGLPIPRVSILTAGGSAEIPTIICPFSDPLHEILIVLIVCRCIPLNITMAFLEPNIVRAIDHCRISVHNLRGRNLLTVVLAPCLVKPHSPVSREIPRSLPTPFRIRTPYSEAHNGPLDIA